MDIQNNQYMIPRALMVSLMVLALLSVLAPPSAAGQIKGQGVEKTLIKRTEALCNSMFQSWLSAESGIQSPDVQALVTDCYTGQIRLSVLGVEPSLPLATIALKEIPAQILKKKTGISLDVYRPLAGRVLQTSRTGQ